MTRISAAGWWGRGSVWMALIALVTTSCAMRESVSGPQVEQDPFTMFDRISPPTPGPGISIPAGGFITTHPSLARTKPAGKSKSKSQLIPADDGGSITVLNFPTLARLTVLSGSIETDTVIDMNVLGSTGSIGIDFGPDGLSFSPSAVLDIVRPIEDYDPDNLRLFLTSADGSVEELEVEVITFGSWMRVRTWIAHFSGVGDEEDDGASEEDEL